MSVRYPTRATGRAGQAALRSQLDRLSAAPPVRPLALPAPPDPGISEADYQALIVELAEWLGYAAYHTRDSRGSNPGFPDLTLARRTGPGPGQGRALFREIKALRGRVKPEQARWGELLLAAGLDWKIVRPTPEDWAELLADLLREA
jgi:hypothetical protein